MRNKLLLTTALVAALGTANVQAMEINTDQTYQGEDGGISTSDSLEISSGKITMTDTAIHANGITVSGAEITLSDTDFTNDNQSKSFNVSGGTITMNGNGAVIGTNESNCVGADCTAGKFEMSDGIINVNGGNVDLLSEKSNYIEASEVLISGGKLNIAKDAYLGVVSGILYDKDSEGGDGTPAEDAKPIELHKGTITLTSGEVALSGSVNSDITGDNNGLLSLNDSSAKVFGDVDGVNLDIKSSIKLADTFKGTLSAGKTTIYGGKALDLGVKTLNTDSFEVKDNGTLAFQVSGLNNHGKIIADDITIGTTGTNLNLTLDTSVLAKDQTETFTILDSNNITGAFANLSKNARYEFSDNGDGTFDITGKATAGDVVSDAGGNANNARTATAWDNTLPAQAKCNRKICSECFEYSFAD